jgi:hypothetical protein
MKKVMKFVLTRPARSSGGDRYEHGVQGDEDFMTIYLPQSLSRTGVEIKKDLTVTFE